ncbi:hypothetical protein VTO42DRAFT_7479 [Malbranchea cinnamomea]
MYDVCSVVLITTRTTYFVSKHPLLDTSGRTLTQIGWRSLSAKKEKTAAQGLGQILRRAGEHVHEEKQTHGQDFKEKQRNKEMNKHLYAFASFARTH